MGDVAEQLLFIYKKYVEKIKQEDEKEQKRDIKVFIPPSLKSSFIL